MTIRNFRDVKAGHPVSASELNRLGAEVEKATNFTGANVSYGVGGLNIAEEQEGSFWARLGANDGLTPAAHAWTKLQENADGTFSDDDQNITGSTTVNPAYSIDGSAAPVGSRVRLLPAQTGDYFLYDPGMSGGTGSSLEVKEADGSPDVLNITVIVVDQATGLAIESSAAGTVTLQNLNAGASQIGVVNLSFQVLGAGDKRFSNKLFLAYGATGEVIWSTTNDATDADSPYIHAEHTELILAIGNDHGSSPQGLIVSSNLGVTNITLSGLGAYQVDETTDGGILYTGITGSFTALDGSTVTVRGGIVVGIDPPMGSSGMAGVVSGGAISGVGVSG